MSALYFEIYFEPRNEVTEKKLGDYIQAVQAADHKAILKLDREKALHDPAYYLDNTLTTKQTGSVFHLEFDTFTSFDWPAFVYFLHGLGDACFELRVHNSQTGHTFLYANLKNIAHYQNHDWKWLAADEEYDYRAAEDITSAVASTSSGDRMSIGFALFKYGILAPIILIGVVIYYPFAVIKHKTLFIRGKSRVSVRVTKKQQYIPYLPMPDAILAKSVGLEVPVRIPELGMLEYKKVNRQSPHLYYLDFMKAAKAHDPEIFEWVRQNYTLPKVKISKLNIEFDMAACDIIDQR